MARTNAGASVLGQAQMNVNGTALSGWAGGGGSTHVWTWGLLIFLLLILLLHYFGSGGLRGSVAS